MLIREPFPGPAQPGLNLVQHEEDAPVVAQLPQARQVSGGWDVDASLPLNRLDEDGGGLIVDDGRNNSASAASAGTVIDVGVSRSVDPETGKSRFVGDVDPGAAEVAGWLAPMPGGVGPMTRAMLVNNVVLAAERALA